MKVFNTDELRKRVDEILYYVWDPIGVSDEPAARGEYENYVPAVVKLIEENETKEPISLYLAEIMTNEMGGPSDKERCDHAAELLLDHKWAIKEGLY